MKTTVQRVLFAFLLGSLTLAAAKAAPAISGPTKFVIADCAKDSIVLRFTAEALPLAVRSKDIANADPPDAPVAWSISWDKPQVSDASIKEYQVTGTLKGGCPTTGAYTVPVSVSGGEGLPSTTTLSITVVRTVDPILDAPSSVTLALERWPFIRSDSLSVSAIQLRETSHAASIGQIGALGRELKAASGETTEITLKPDPAPLSISKGGGAELKLALSQMPVPGTYTTRLILNSPLLKQNQSIDVTVKVRIFWIFLLGTIGAGIGLGWWVNVKLAQTALLDAALLEGLRAAAMVARRATAQKSSVVQQRLIAIASALESAVRKVETPPEVQAKIAEAQAQATKIEEAALASASTFTQGLARVRSVVEPNHSLLAPAVAELLAKQIARLDYIESIGASGEVEQAQTYLQSLEQTLQKDIFAKLQPWLLELQSGLDKLGPWAGPAEDLDQSLKDLGKAVRLAFSQADTGQLVQECDKIARDLMVILAFTAPRKMAEVFRSAALVLRQGQRSDIAEKLSMQADDLISHNTLGFNPIVALQDLTQVRQKMVALLRTAANGNVQVDNCLSEGNFPAAANKMIPPTVVPQNLPASLPTIPLVPLADNKTILGNAPPASIAPRVQIPLDMKIGSTFSVKVAWPDAPHDVPPHWSCSPEKAAEITNVSASGLEASVTPKKAGFLTISVARASASSPIASGTAYVGDVTEEPDWKQIANRVRVVQTQIAIATALLTAFAGYQIFNASWFGTFGDFFSAFVWGFFGQFGLERVRNLANPITSRTLS